jgi:DNA-binding NarL/FixJ family response regulator
LSLRELEVLRLLAQGLNNRVIAEALFISDRTVQAHLTSIFAKMHVSSRLEAVLQAIRRGWLTLDD